jgi:hypothetical protein
MNTGITPNKTISKHLNFIFSGSIASGVFVHGDATAISYLVVLLLGMPNAAKLLTS